MFKYLFTLGIILIGVTACVPLSQTEFRNAQGVRLLYKQGDSPGSFLHVNWTVDSQVTLQKAVAPGTLPMFIGDINTYQVVPIIDNSNKIISGYSPTISSDGKWLAFRSGSGAINVQVKSLDTGNIETIDVFGSMLAWSPHSDKLAVLNMNTKDVATLYIYSLLEKRSKKIYSYSEKNLTYNLGNSMSWSPDGKELAFSLSYEGQNQPLQNDLFLYHLDTDQWIRITSSNDDDEEYPIWYPNSNILAFTLTLRRSAPFVDARLVFSTNDGGCRKTLTGLMGMESPAWSPDGKQMAFISEDGVELMDVAQVIPQEFLSPQKLCQPNN